MSLVKRQHWSKCLYKILKIVFYKNLNTVPHTLLSFLAIVYINYRLAILNLFLTQEESAKLIGQLLQPKLLFKINVKQKLSLRFCCSKLCGSFFTKQFLVNRRKHSV